MEVGEVYEDVAGRIVCRAYLRVKLRGIEREKEESRGGCASVVGKECRVRVVKEAVEVGRFVIDLLAEVAESSVTCYAYVGSGFRGKGLPLRVAG